MAKRYYWLKLKADWFSDKHIKKLRSIAGGDTHTIIYLKMMLLSLKDEGKLYFEGVEDNFASEIALALDEDAENVKLTLAFLQRHGLIEIGDDDECQLTEVQTIIGFETASAMRVREKEGENGTPAPAAYGRFHNVFLSDAELDALKTELSGKWEYYIDRLSVHIASSGKQYQNHAATIYKWAQEDAEKAAITGNALKKGIPDYSYSEEDSL